MTEQEKQNATDRPKRIFLTLQETAEYLGFAKSTLYKMTMKKTIPFYKPNGRKVYFLIEDLNKFILRNPIRSEEQLERTAEMYFNKCEEGNPI